MDQDPPITDNVDTDFTSNTPPAQPNSVGSAQSNIVGSTRPTPVNSVQPTPVDTAQPDFIGSAQPTVVRQISRPVDSHHIDRDLRLPGDKSHQRRRLVLFSILGTAVVLLVALLVWFFAFYNQPTTAMLDGVQHLFGAQNVVLHGSGAFDIHDDDSSSTSIKKGMFDFNSASSSLPNAFDANLFLERNNTTGNDTTGNNLSLNGVIMSDGIVYAKIDGLSDYVRSFDGFDPETDSYTAVEIAEGEWWRIALDEIIEQFTGDASVAQLYQQLYQCGLSTISQDNSKVLAQLYSEHQFIEVTPVKQLTSADGYADYQPAAWHNLYEITLNSTALADFINALPTTSTAEAMYACYNTALQAYNPASTPLSATDFSEVSADDLEFPEKLHLYAEISQFGHKIRSLWAYFDDETVSNVFTLDFKYQPSTVEPPSEYRNLVELFDEDSFSDLMVDGNVGIDDYSDDFSDDLSDDTISDDADSETSPRDATNHDNVNNDFDTTEEEWEWEF